MKSAQSEPGAHTSRLPGARRAGVFATVSAVLCSTSMLAIPAANAAVPAFPDNIVVFPDRDFVSVEGYEGHAGDMATLEVKRADEVIGSARSLVDGGGVAFEVNHPGGVCWGAGTGLNVTPDIRPGDVVSIKFDKAAAAPADETTVQDVYVTGNSVLTGSTLTVKGHIGSSVNAAQMEQRIIEPALKDTDVARRDIRAVPGVMTPAPKGGYSSSLEVVGNEFTAVYEFLDPATAKMAADAGLGERAMAWQSEDADANRQGLTIAEYGEPGGPGMGGCPNGPLQSGPPAPSDITAAKVAGGLKLNWKPATAIPGTPAITGYRAVAVGKTMTNGEQVEIGKRISGQAASSTTITGLSATEEYDVYVVGISSVGETFPAAHAIPVTDTTAPTVSATPSGGTSPVAQRVTLTASETGSDIYYTVDGSEPVLSGGVLGTNVIHYTGPMNIASTSTLKFAAFDPSGNVSTTSEVLFTVTNDPVPSAPTFASAPVVGQGTASLSWTAPNPGAAGLSITGYSVQAYTTDGTPFGAPKTTTGDVTSLVYGGLNGDTAYQFTVRASNTNGMGPESAKTAAATAQGAVVAIAGPDQNVVRRTTATPVTLDGTGSTATGATYKWVQVLSGATDPNKVTLTGDTTLKPTFSLPVFKTPMTNAPLVFRLTVTSGATVRTDEVQVVPVADRVTITGQWKSGDFKLSGTGSVVGSTVTVRTGSATGPVLGQAAVTAAAAPATGGIFSLRLRNAAAGTTNPGSVWVESNAGGTAGPVTISNK
ncbi:fibronectin type III domain-containing protein [Arthrobacter sp. FW305-BF8]|uniref:fibronectin type III domain-containing protein n=1 Tax=Arthrobacter sp. FW305-BF8 TaxID=2879617 RepID=UPI001F025224|nr:fibronectin type III domain-containing protein [Arthrobacter sp. FW305-BF8]UKA54590.1 fibronectin type III domain-containing protein [Arthrobacter sp. FW305-BF8]